MFAASGRFCLAPQRRAKQRVPLWERRQRCPPSSSGEGDEAGERDRAGQRCRSGVSPAGSRPGLRVAGLRPYPAAAPCEGCRRLPPASRCDAAGAPCWLRVAAGVVAVMLGASFPLLTLIPLASHLGAAFPVFPSLGCGSCVPPRCCLPVQKGFEVVLLPPPGMLQPLVKALTGLRWVLVSLLSQSHMHNSSRGPGSPHPCAIGDGKLSSLVRSL